MIRCISGILFLISLLPLPAPGQEVSLTSRVNTISFFSEYSNTSSYVHWGVSRKRRLVASGVSYSRLLNAPHWFDWRRKANIFYEAEIYPVVTIQDPVATDIYGSGRNPVIVSQPIVERCRPGAYISYYGVPFQRIACTTEWSYMGGATPVGFRMNFRPQRRFQPFIDAHLGFFAGSHDEPVPDSSNVNFTFEFGAGIELMSLSIVDTRDFTWA